MSQIGSTGPPARQAATQPRPKESQILQLGGMLTLMLAPATVVALVEWWSSVVGTAETSAKMVVIRVVKKAVCILEIEWWL